MQFVVISGRSGSGKSSALQMLEDMGFTCIDNLPVSLLPALITQIAASDKADLKFAIGIDARNISGDLQQFPSIIQSAKFNEKDCKIIYLDSASPILIKRFSETRRKHPLSSQSIGLAEAIQKEKEILQPIAAIADITINTTNLTIHNLRSVIKKSVASEDADVTAISFESFGFKYGTPPDADFVFDVRCLPNPYWVPDLRGLTGLDQGVINFLANQKDVNEMLTDIRQFTEKWVPSFEANNRSYLTIAIGCTGGMHRSVFLAEKLGEYFRERFPNVQVRHRQLPGIGNNESAQTFGSSSKLPHDSTRQTTR